MRSRPNHLNRFLRTPFTARGASLIEIMISLTVISVSALAAASFFTQQVKTTRNLTRVASCKTALDSQLSYIRQMTAIAPGYEWNGKGSDATQTKNLAANPGANGDQWLGNSVRLADTNAKDIIAGAGGVRELNTHLLQKGSMGFLASMYNNIPNIRDGVDLSSLELVDPSRTLPAQVDGENLKDFTVNMAIRTFNLGTGEEESSGAQGYIRPQGLRPADLTASGIATFPADTTDRYGYRVILTGTFTDPTGDRKSCVASEDFSFPIDLEGPKVSAVLNAFDLSLGADSIAPYDQAMANPRNRPECTQTSANRDAARLRLEVGFRTTVPAHDKLDSGTVFMCRDVSEQMNPNYCQNAVNAQMNGQAWTPTSGRWVPCNEATACGMRASRVDFVRDAPGAVRYVLNYDQSTKTSQDGLWGCDVRMDMATIDAAGNFKLLSENIAPNRHPTIGGITAIGGYYFQPTQCYACYKKKPFSFLTIALIVGGGLLVAATGGAAAIAAAAAAGGGFAAGGVLACAAGIAGACKVKGYNFKGNKCEIPSGYTLNRGKRMCRKLTPRYPNWFVAGNIGGAGGRSCPALTATYPGRTETYTFAATPSGGQGSAEFFDLPSGTTCAAAALCENGRWTPEEDQTQIAVCNTLKVAVQMDSNFRNDQKICIMEVPQGSRATLIDRSYYNQFSNRCYDFGGDSPCAIRSPRRRYVACSGPGCVDNNRGRVCSGSSVRTGDYCHQYPVDALDPGRINTGPVYYHFVNYNNATDSNLGFCDSQENAGD